MLMIWISWRLLEVSGLQLLISMVLVMTLCQNVIFVFYNHLKILAFKAGDRLFLSVNLIKLVNYLKLLDFLMVNPYACKAAYI